MNASCWADMSLFLMVSGNMAIIYIRKGNGFLLDEFTARSVFQKKLKKNVGRQFFIDKVIRNWVETKNCGLEI